MRSVVGLPLINSAMARVMLSSCLLLFAAGVAKAEEASAPEAEITPQALVGGALDLVRGRTGSDLPRIRWNQTLRLGSRR